MIPPPPPAQPAPNAAPATSASLPTAPAPSYPPPPPPPPAQYIPPAQAIVVDPKELKEHVLNWRVASEQLKTLKAKEMMLRKKVVDLAFNGQTLPNGSLPEGTNRRIVETPSFVMSFSVVQKYKREVLEELMNATLIEIENAMEGEPLPAECTDIIRTKYELSISAYRALPDKVKPIMEKMILTKPASIELEATVAPK